MRWLAGVVSPTANDRRIKSDIVALNNLAPALKLLLKVYQHHGNGISLTCKIIHQLVMAHRQ